jgi:hypothetical protein
MTGEICGAVLVFMGSLRQGGGDGCAGDGAGIGQSGYRPAQADQFVGLGGADYTVSQAAAFGFEVGIAHGPRERAERIRDVLGESPPIVQADI